MSGGGFESLYLSVHPEGCVYPESRCCSMILMNQPTQTAENGVRRDKRTHQALMVGLVFAGR
jgi:hypothetical protein